MMTSARTITPGTTRIRRVRHHGACFVVAAAGVGTVAIVAVTGAGVGTGAGGVDSGGRTSADGDRSGGIGGSDARAIGATVGGSDGVVPVVEADDPRSGAVALKSEPARARTKSPLRA